MPRSLKLFAALIFLSAMLVPTALAQSNVRIVRISDIEGQVDIDNGAGYEGATINMPLAEGARIATREDGWAEIQFEDGSTVRLAPESELVLSQLKFSDEGAGLTTVDMTQGEAEFEVAYEDRGSFQVNTPQKSVLLHQSGRFRVRSDSSNPLELVVWAGEVGVFDQASGEEVHVRDQETFFLDPSDTSSYDLEKKVAEDDLDQWSTQRDDYLSKNAGDAHTQSPYNYGVSDLDSDGQYYDVPDYGYMWRPNGVSLDWDPFSNGYWCQTPFGFTWVSAYRWGWMPYRYGRWVFINGRGWFWEPGSWHGWQRIPPVLNPPPRFRRPPTPPPGVVPNKIAGHPGPIGPPDHRYPGRVGPPEDRRAGPPQPPPTPGQHIYPQRIGPPQQISGPPQPPSGHIYPLKMGPPAQISGPPQPVPGPEPRIVPGRIGPPQDRGRIDPPQPAPGPDTRIVPGRIMPPEDRRRVDPPQPQPAQVRRDNPPQPQPAPMKTYNPPQQPPTPAPAPVKTYTPPQPPAPAQTRSYSPPPSPPAHQETRSAPAQSSSNASKDSGDSGKPKR